MDTAENDAGRVGGRRLLDGSPRRALRSVELSGIVEPPRFTESVLGGNDCRSEQEKSENNRAPPHNGDGSTCAK